MDIVIIIGTVFVASVAGYLFRLAVERIKTEQVIITKKHPLEMIPSHIKYYLAGSIFLFIMSILTLVTNFLWPS